MASEQSYAELAQLVRQALDYAVSQLGGSKRLGQEKMALDTLAALVDDHHLLAQAGTGTGKSLAYLIPALIWAAKCDKRVLVTTATLALQTQLANKDIPTAKQAVEHVLGCEVRSQVLRGRSNYICRYKIGLEAAEISQDALISAAEVSEAVAQSPTEQPTTLGAEVLMLREWAQRQAELGKFAERDDAPKHRIQTWPLISVSASECLGVKRCPVGEHCFAEQARARAAQVDLVVANHALLAIEALSDVQVLPEFDAVIIDEAHELVDRITSAAANEFSLPVFHRILKEAKPWISNDLELELIDGVADLEDAIAAAEPGKVTSDNFSLITGCARLASQLRKLVSALGQTEGNANKDNPDKTLVAKQASELYEVMRRLAENASEDVCWISEDADGEKHLNITLLDVSKLIKYQILTEHTTVMTSATLALGGDFKAIARQFGLFDDPIAGQQPADNDADEALAWLGIDAGSPFDYPRQAYLYVAQDLPAPGSNGISEQALERLVELMQASGGATLGLFTSMRAAQQATDYLRTKAPKLPVLCQGEAQLARLTEQFKSDAATSLFGTLSLWQGLDVPGQACQLVVIDRIPFARPDDVLQQARQDAVKNRGGNGFMQVSLTNAALLLAQGVGRLIRSANDRGVVAILDSRYLGRRYGGFLDKSLPPMYRTTDTERIKKALANLSAQR